VKFKINIQHLLFQLFCLYVFLLPFEYILEVLLGIDTILKPYRLTSLAIIGVFGLHTLRSGFHLRKDINEDLWLYAIFAYGLLVSLFRIITGVFNFAYFSNDLFQSGLYVITFFIFKSLPLTDRQLIRVFQFFILGLLINSLYMFNSFVILGIVDRHAGFMDNPNYVALGLVAVISYLTLKLDFLASRTARLGYALLILFLLYIFIITGSRTGLVLLVLVFFLLLYFVSIRRRISLVIATIGLLVLLVPRQFKTIELGGPLILINRVTNTIYSDETEDVRFIIWRGVFRALESTGYYGMGIGQFKSNFPLFFAKESDKLILEVVNRNYHLSVHNDYLAILTDYGLPGLVFYLVFLFLSFRKIFRRTIYPKESDEAPFLNPFTVILLFCLIVFGLAAENFQNQLFWFLLMFATKSTVQE
jgi:O-antigen ligase